MPPPPSTKAVRWLTVTWRWWHAGGRLPASPEVRAGEVLNSGQCRGGRLVQVPAPAATHEAIELVAGERALEQRSCVRQEQGFLPVACLEFAELQRSE
jgi:hypothetical protein